MQKSIFLILSLFLLFSCKQNTQMQTVEDDPVKRDWKEIKESGELVVLTMYGATSYFVYRNQEMGYEYEKAKRLAKDLGVKLNLKIVTDPAKLAEMLLNGEGDLIAYPMPINKKLKRKLGFVDDKKITHQVLVQTISDSMVTSIVDLIGKDIYVPADSKFEDRLHNLNEELGGGINIITVPDSVSVDALIDMVSLKRIPFTLADNDIAALNKTYLKNIDYRLQISFPQMSAWAVRKKSHHLLDTINTWSEHKKESRFFANLYQRYYKRNHYFTEKKVTLLEGRKISEYDHLFKQYSKIIPWDWRMLASMAYHESQFDTTAVSWAGAIGLMQLMPTTGLLLGLEEEELVNPDENVHASARYLKQLNQIFHRVEVEAERTKFVLAAYNVGVGHVTDAMALAEKNGKERYLWDDNVNIYMKLKSKPEYYNDPVCKFGYCRGDDVSNYVSNVTERYQRYLNSEAK